MELERSSTEVQLFGDSDEVTKMAKFNLLIHFDRYFLDTDKDYQDIGHIIILLLGFYER